MKGLMLAVNETINARVLPEDGQHPGHAWRKTRPAKKTVNMQGVQMMLKKIPYFHGAPPSVGVLPGGAGRRGILTTTGPCLGVGSFIEIIGIL